MKRFDRHHFTRHRFGGRHFKRKPINVLASLITTISLYLGLLSCFHSIQGNYETAAYLILGAIICDMLDGTVARLTNTQSEFGKELDSLCDVVSFGVAPAVLIFCAFCYEEQVKMNLVSRAGGFFAILYVICGALRLARFNVYQSGQREYFTGLPIPAAGGTVAAFVLFTQYFNLHVAFYVLGPLTLLLAYLMVSAVRYPKDRLKKALVRPPKDAFRMLVYCALVIGCIHYCVTHSPSIIMFPIAASYVVYGICDDAYARLRGRRQTAPTSEQDEEELPGQRLAAEASDLPAADRPRDLDEGAAIPAASPEVEKNDEPR